MMQKLVKLKRKLLIMIMIYTLPLSELTAENFAARLAQTILVTKTDFDNKLNSLNEKTHSNKTKNFLFKMNLKNYKHLIQTIF